MSSVFENRSYRHACRGPHFPKEVISQRWAAGTIPAPIPFPATGGTPRACAPRPATPSRSSWKRPGPAPSRGGFVQPRPPIAARGRAVPRPRIGQARGEAPPPAGRAPSHRPLGQGGAFPACLAPPRPSRRSAPSCPFPVRVAPRPGGKMSAMEGPLAVFGERTSGDTVRTQNGNGGALRRGPGRGGGKGGAGRSEHGAAMVPPAMCSPALVCPGTAAPLDRLLPSWAAAACREGRKEGGREGGGRTWSTRHPAPLPGV